MKGCVARGLALLILVGGIAGCEKEKGKVLGVSNHDSLAISIEGVTDLTAEDLAIVMRRAGFTDEQILDLGPELHDALATQGAAEIRIKNKVQAIMAVNDNRLHVSSRGRGTFIYALTPRLPENLLPGEPANKPKSDTP
jgi:hypothetical protein